MGATASNSLGGRLKNFGGGEADEGVLDTDLHGTDFNFVGVADTGAALVDT